MAALGGVDRDVSAGKAPARDLNRRKSPVQKPPAFHPLRFECFGNRPHRAFAEPGGPVKGEISRARRRHCNEAGGCSSRCFRERSVPRADIHRIRAGITRTESSCHSICVPNCSSPLAVRSVSSDLSGFRIVTGTIGQGCHDECAMGNRF